MRKPTIWKMPLAVTDEQEIGAEAYIERVLSAGLDADGDLCVWCLVDPGRDDWRTVKVSIVGTGNPLPFWVGDFVGSVTMPPFVWHVFALLTDSDRSA